MARGQGCLIITLVPSLSSTHWHLHGKRLTSIASTNHSWRFCRRHLPSPPAEPETLKQHLIMLCLGPKSSKSSPFHQEQSPMVYTVLHNLAHLTSASPSTPCSYVPATMTNLFHDLPQGLCTGCFPCLECYSSSLITSISFLSTIRWKGKEISYPPILNYTPLQHFHFPNPCFHLFFSRALVHHTQ